VYVVHLHDARRRHYDLRIEIGGALESFSVPRGPTLDPHERRLAVRTEPHPIEYLDFEDVIPDGNYGAGPMIAWDRGRVRYIGAPAEQQLEKGKLDFELSGYKLHGRFTLVHSKKSEKDWLLFKKNDAFAREGSDIVTAEPRSIYSGLAVEELGSAAAIARAIGEDAARRGAPLRAIDPDMIPMVPSTGGKGRTRSGMIYELALDGVRTLARKNGREAVLLDGQLRDMTRVYPEIARAVRSLAAEEVVLDGEIIALDDAGQPSLERLAQRIHLVRDEDVRRAMLLVPAIYVVFDLLAIEGRDLRPLPLRARKELLRRLLPGAGMMRVLDALEGDPGPLLELCSARNLEGIIAKRADAPYRPGPKQSRDWVKLTCDRTTGSRGHDKDQEAEIERLSADVAESAHAKPAANAKQRVTISNPAKVLWPGEGFTKKDLASYYKDIAPVMLPHLRDRPVMLVRYPDGIEGKSFYQWNVPPGLPPWMQTLRIQFESQEPMDVFHIRDADTLLYVTNMAAIPIHVLASRAASIEACDFFTIDLDVSGGTFGHVITLARTLRGMLDTIGLVGFPKTSGQSGLHVFVPLGPGNSYETARTLADLLGHLLAARHPDIATMERMKVNRGPRVYVDTGQTGPSRTIVAPYAVRAKPGATVSTPLEWDEVTETLDPRAFDIRSVLARVDKLGGDPMARLLDVRPSVADAAARLEKLVRGVRLVRRGKKRAA
jgi:bifunctional non-homologous end joining protein LigD